MPDDALDHRLHGARRHAARGADRELADAFEAENSTVRPWGHEPARLDRKAPRKPASPLIILAQTVVLWTGLVGGVGYGWQVYHAKGVRVAEAEAQTLISIEEARASVSREYAKALREGPDARGVACGWIIGQSLARSPDGRVGENAMALCATNIGGRAQ